jgi:hypothetical protein
LLRWLVDNNFLLEDTVSVIETHLGPIGRPEPTWQGRLIVNTQQSIQEDLEGPWRFSLFLATRDCLLLWLYYESIEAEFMAATETALPYLHSDLACRIVTLLQQPLPLGKDGTSCTGSDYAAQLVSLLAEISERFDSIRLLVSPCNHGEAFTSKGEQAVIDDFLRLHPLYTEVPA